MPSGLSFGSSSGSSFAAAGRRSDETAMRLGRLLMEQPEILGRLAHESGIGGIIAGGRFDPGFRFDPGLIIDPGFRGPLPPPAAPAASGNLQLAISALRFANAGDVIRSEEHNNLVTALILLAREIGIAPGVGTITMTFAPAFLADGNKPAW